MNFSNVLSTEKVFLVFNGIIKFARFFEFHYTLSSAAVLCSVTVICDHLQTKMASLAAAALLDELMGRNRNILPDDVQNKINWDDQDVSCFGFSK